MVDPKEAMRFFELQLNRCKINLQGANDRRDERAASNIQRKIRIYEYVIKILCGKEAGG